MSISQETNRIGTPSTSRRNYLTIVLSYLLVAAIVIMGFILLIVPGIIFAIRLAFVPYLVMDKGLEPVAAVEKSWNMTRDHGWAIFGAAGYPHLFRRAAATRRRGVLRRHLDLRGDRIDVSRRRSHGTAAARPEWPLGTQRVDV